MQTLCQLRQFRIAEFKHHWVRCVLGGELVQSGGRQNHLVRLFQFGLWVTSVPFAELLIGGETIDERLKLAKVTKYSRGYT